MNTRYFRNSLTALILAATLNSCVDMLNEAPRSNLTPEFFMTAQGLESGLISAYSGLRFQYGPGGALECTVIGTDEFTTSDAMNGVEESLDNYDSQLNSVNGQITNGWNRNYSFINTCNGVIQYGQNASMNEVTKSQMIAEAKFLRSHFYFLLVQTYGGVPLDLGSGELNFNTSPSTRSVRNTAAEVYEAIINDLLEAVNDLPDRPAKKGRIAKAAALHFLSKAYLTRAGHPEASKSDDYANAYKYANQLIENQGQYGTSLSRDYRTVNLEGHEDDQEVLFNVQRTSDYVFGESNVDAPHSGLKENRANFFFTAGYENVKIQGVAVTPRCVEYQRPWRMFIPTEWLIFEAFAEKSFDSRWDNSFRMAWLCRANKENGTSDADILKLKEHGIEYGDTAIVILLTDEVPAYYKDKKYAIYTPKQFYSYSSAQYIYPNLMKFDDTKRMNMNYSSMRTTIAARFAETYLIAAEALIMQGRASEALPYVNTVRRRAAYRASLSASQLFDAENAMTITNPALLTLDFILDERTREMCGEQWRWFDLVRTNKLLERARLHNVKARPNIKEYHMVRPIPQSQIDLLSDPAQKAVYQNPGYN